jgi:hypothetical protein
LGSGSWNFEFKAEQRSFLQWLQCCALLSFLEQSFSTFSLERKGGAKSSSEFDAVLLCVRSVILTNSRLGNLL